MADDHYATFLTFALERYPDCTLEQKLEMYLNHHPIRAVVLLQELIIDTHRVDWIKMKTHWIPRAEKHHDSTSPD